MICDKPVTTTVKDAVDLAGMVRRTGLVFGLTHNYTGYPLVRQARQMIPTESLGPIRVCKWSTHRTGWRRRWRGPGRESRPCWD